MAVCASNAIGLADGDRVLPIVPMFHANAWGQPYAAMMAGADLLLPDRFLQAAPLVGMIEQQRPTIAAAVPTIWNDVLQYLHANPGRDISSLRTVACGGSAVPLGMMEEYEERYGVVIRQGWGMTETSPLAALATPPPEVTGAGLSSVGGIPVLGGFPGSNRVFARDVVGDGQRDQHVRGGDEQDRTSTST